MTIQEALKETSVAKAHCDGKTIGVRDDEYSEVETPFTVWFQDGNNPPHHAQKLYSIDDVETYIKENFPASILAKFTPEL